MRVSIAFLVAGYVLSQFYRACLAVLTPVLGSEIGASGTDLAVSLGLWYIAFALMQIPVGEALDRIGPRLTVSVLLGLGGGGGAAVFALAQGPMAVHLAMVLIGIGCAPVLMGAYYIFARSFPPAIFGTLAGATIGVGSLGNLAGAAPLAWLIETAGWRQALWGLAVITLVVALAIARFTRDPERITRPATGGGSVLDILRLPAIWFLLPLIGVNYAAAAGLRGVWAGPYFSTLYGADTAAIGLAMLVMGLAMVAGNFAYGAADRVLGSHKRVVLLGNALQVVILCLLWLMPGPGFWASTAMIAAIGLFGASFPAMMAHGRSFFPPHLMGRGVTLLNMFSIGGVGLFQFASRPVFESAQARGTPAEAFAALFLFFLLPLIAGLALYAFSRTRGDEV
ncbi:MFS transporter [Phaeovulum sp. NW3]|uniref:MFS transporter n=1 Tax=Phaeovulum sp. NW3 TaxID=2934933 RepID=UPI00202215A6|nr:MFS transporter [Phaeovulum sp. NW3]MCL7463578.1 MFS transporter [Phaeovulum sp. NW3]